MILLILAFIVSMIPAIALAVLDIVLVILLVRFIRKGKGQEKYTTPLPLEGN